MIKAGFDDSMRAILSELNGARLFSYESENVRPVRYVFCNLRLNASCGSIEIFNLQREFPFYDDFEEMSCFSCARVDPSEPFRPITLQETQVSPIDKIVTSVELITDEISVWGDKYQIAFDVALVLRMGEDALMLARDIWFSDIISICDNDDYDSFYPIKDVKYDFSDEDGDGGVVVNPISAVDVRRIRQKL